MLLDFDNDGDLDLALTDEIADVVLLMRNDERRRARSARRPRPRAARRSRAASRTLTIRNKTPDKGDLITWKWTKGAATTKAEFGDPLTSDDYALCIYDAGALVTSAVADAGGICGTQAVLEGEDRPASATRTG